MYKQIIDTKKKVVFSEWEIHFVTQANEKMKLTEVSVQHWDKGQIIKEKFYYKDIYPIS